MERPKIIHLEKKEFEKRFGKYPYGHSGFEEVHARKPVIFLKKGLSKEITKATLAHELGHLIIAQKKIISRIPRSERKRIVEEAKGSYPKRLYKSKRKLLEEAIADFYAYQKTGTKEEKEYLREKYSKTMEIVKESLRRKRHVKRPQTLFQVPIRKQHTSFFQKGKTQFKLVNTGHLLGGNNKFLK